MDAGALGELAGALFDRGLRLMSLDIAIDEHGAAFVTLAARVCDAAHLTEHLAPWRDDGGTGFDWTSSADFVAGFLGAQRGSRLQRDAVRALILSRSSTS